ncbi:MAG: suppressor of fused domain protein [Mycobacteriaceae bacterium]
MLDVIGAVESHLRSTIGGPDPVRASVTFVGVQPVDVLRFGPDSERVVRYVTLGCSRQPMGDPDAMLTEVVAGPRAELMLALRGGVDGAARSMAILAATPAVEGLVLQEDSLVDLQEPLWPGSAFGAVILGSSGVANLELGGPLDPVMFLQAVPVTATEAAWVRLRGAQALRDAWAEAGVDIRDPGRSAVSL